METVVMGIQADVTKLSKNHNHTANTVSKLLDKSRKLSVRERMDKQGVQVKKLEANHAHLIERNNFKVLIFQEEKEIPSSVFVKQPVPFPRDQEGEGEGEGELRPPQDGPAQDEEGLHTIDLSSDEDVGLEAELEEEGEDLYDLEFTDKTRAEKIKRSSLKKVDSLKKALENKMSQQRDKIRKTLSSNQTRAGFKASSEARDSPGTEAHVELSPLALSDEGIPFTEVHSQLAPGGGEEREEEREEERGEEREEEREEEIPGVLPGEVSLVSEGCIIHWEQLVSKSLNLDHVMKPVMEIVNYIRTYVLNHRQFKNLIAELDQELPGDLPLHCTVRWLSKGKGLSRFSELLDAAKLFMEEKDKDYPELSAHAETDCLKAPLVTEMIELSEEDLF
ncbi:hypothetical protein NHX12_014982 [Muraenolepis orangiensis]|uniref:Uncharacterized protein n=1 Tax=Muraenolepis orangiensis TaxID=630683 RepID=A0A9Q0I2K9_9TELE|nr:hypothetical protein NHX12_014982 [Muraenolepis orangiensis]